MRNPGSAFRIDCIPSLTETTGGEFRVFRASIRLLLGVWTFYKAPITVPTHLKNCPGQACRQAHHEEHAEEDNTPADPNDPNVKKMMLQAS